MKMQAHPRASRSRRRRASRGRCRKRQVRRRSRPHDHHLDRPGPQGGGHTGRERVGHGPGASVNVVVKDFGKIRDDLGTVRRGRRTRRHHRRPRLDRPARGQRPRAADRPERRRRRRSSRRTRSTRSRTAPPSRSSTASRSQIENIGLVVNTKLAKVPTTFAQLEKEALAFKKKKAGNLAHRRPAGHERRRVPHVPVLLGPRRLRLRHQQGRQPRPVGHRRGEQGVPEEREARSTSGTRKG